LGCFSFYYNKMFRKNTITLIHIYEHLRQTVSWFNVQNRQRLIAELESIRVVKSGSKVNPILYDTYDCKWNQNENLPICDIV
jgi:hypothetical protein